MQHQYLRHDTCHPKKSTWAFNRGGNRRGFFCGKKKLGLKELRARQVLAETLTQTGAVLSGNHQPARWAPEPNYK